MLITRTLWLFAAAVAGQGGNSEPPSEPFATDCPSGYSLRGACVPVGTSPLQFYVDMPDPTYSYAAEPIQTFGLPGATAFVLNMTSQRWLTDDDFKQYSPSKSVWRHQLVVVVPKKLNKQLDTGWLWITGGDNEPDGGFKPIDTKDGEVAIAGELAAASGTVCAVLLQVPNQPVAFTVDIPHDPNMYPRELRGEDGIISYTWNHFVLKDNHSPEWLSRLPMTKAVVRAMDTVTDYAMKHFDVQVSKFVVGGASKRGWTTWTTGTVEPRCAAIVPVVMDLLNLANNTDRAYESLGGWTFEYKDYTEAGMVGPVTKTPEFARLADIVDAYSYISTKRGARSPWPSPQ